MRDPFVFSGEVRGSFAEMQCVVAKMSVLV